MIGSAGGVRGFPPPQEMSGEQQGEGRAAQPQEQGSPAGELAGGAGEREAW